MASWGHFGILASSTQPATGESNGVLAAFLIVGLVSYLITAWNLQALVRDRFDPYGRINVSSLSDFVDNQFIGFRNVLTAIRYEHWRSATNALTEMRTVVVVSLAFIVVATSVWRNEYVLLRWGGILLPLLNGGVQALVTLKLKDMQNALR